MREYLHDLGGKHNFIREDSEITNYKKVLIDIFPQNKKLLITNT